MKDELHNKGGTISTQDVRVPLPNRSVDRIILQSVFTHMIRLDIEHYLREFRRVLKSSGFVYATMFIYDDAILEKARLTNLTPWNLRFEYQLGDGCRINNPEHPTGAVAYTRKTLKDMMQESGLRLAKPLLKGAWSGFYADPDAGQDVAIFAPTVFAMLKDWMSPARTIMTWLRRP